MNKKTVRILRTVIIVLLLVAGLYLRYRSQKEAEPVSTLQPLATVTLPSAQSEAESATAGDILSAVGEYSGEAFCVLNDNIPLFTQADMTTEAYEYFSELDELGRCGVTMACVGQELMPTEARESISHVKPSGWINNPYDFVDGGMLYNRCHLIGFQLTGENANKQNLITGTRYLNVDGMLPFENMVADYVKETGNHVLYRVTPIFSGDELVARGVQLEAWSVEDEGEGVCYNVYAYNVQPGVIIDYKTGDNRADESLNSSDSADARDYVLNTGSHKFHLPECSGAQSMDSDNRQNFFGSRDELLAKGYDACGLCKP